MTVLSVQDSNSQYTGTGDRTFYEYGFDWNGEPVNVRVNGRPVGYTQQANGIVLDVAPAVGDNITIARETPITQETDFRVFGPFDAAKTEDAMDKLILLKQETFAYRAKVNLYADQQLAYTDLVNDTGTTPRITLWNEEQSGVFAGEVTMAMPEAGSFVEKPEDFVYFQYGDTPILTEVLTTTPYPIELTESLEMGCDMTFGAMRTIPEDEMNIAASFVSGSVIETLLDGGVLPDAMDIAAAFISGSVVATLLEGSVPPDEMDISAAFISGSKELKLVTAYTPDESIQMGCDMNPSGCSMTPV